MTLVAANGRGQRPSWDEQYFGARRSEAFEDLAARAGITPDELRAYLRRLLSDDRSADVRETGAPTVVVKPDPRVRRDGLCVVCRQPRSPAQGRYAGVTAALDPFCSTACCKHYHRPVDVREAS